MAPYLRGLYAFSPIQKSLGLFNRIICRVTYCNLCTLGHFGTGICNLTDPNIVLVGSESVKKPEIIMKTISLLNKLTQILAVALVALLVGCGQAPSSSDSSDAAKIDALEKENQKLKESLASAQKRIGNLLAERGGTTTVVQSGLSVPEILDELKEIKMTSENKSSVQRRINFLLESLVEQGDASVPHIRDFLNEMEDVEFAVQRSSEEESRSRGRSDRANEWMERMRNRGRSSSSLSFDQPPSLRIALMDVLKEIGGSNAEATLGEVLSKTARGFEVAYVAKTVRSMIGDDAYRKEAIAAAHDLLSNPIEIPNPNTFDRNSKRYLFNVLEMYNDQTFIQIAQGMLVTDDGKIDNTVLDYLDDVGKEQSMDAIYQAFKSGNVTDRGDLEDLAEAGVKYAGSNPQANQMFNEIMSSDDTDMRVKWSVLREMDDSDDTAVLQSRLNLMSNIQPGENEAENKVMQMYSRQLEAKINGEEFDMRNEMRSLGTDFWRSAFGGRGDDRGRGDRGRDRGGDRRNQPTVIRGQ